jgi:O-antigen/teichoic acid export membrane protein
MFEKLKQLSKDTAVYGISTMLGRFLNFLLVPFYTNIFLPAEYGIITNVYAFMALFNIILLYGMDSAFLKFASLNELGDEKDNFSTPYLSVLIVSFIVSTVLLFFRSSVSDALGVEHSYQYLFYLVSPILFLDAITAIPFIKLRLQRRAKKFAAIKIINIVTNVILNLVFILKLKSGIEGVFISNLAASAITLILMVPLIRENIRFRIHKQLLARLLKFGIPYLPSGLASMMIQVINRPIIEKLTNLSTLGIYQANYKLGIFMMLFVNMFQYAWQPFFMAESKEQNAKQTFAKVLTYFLIVGSVILVVMSLFIDDLVMMSIFGKHLIGEAYWSGLKIVPVVLFAYLLNGLYVVFTAGIFIKEKSIYVPFITGAGAVINIAANIILIPVLGIMGAALATLASYAIMAALLFLVTQKIYQVNYEYGRIFKIFLIIGLLGFAYYYLLSIDSLDFMIKAGLLMLFFVSMLIFVLDRNEWNFILKKFFKSSKNV